jgi:hypothetical protein
MEEMPGIQCLYKLSAFSNQLSAVVVIIDLGRMDGWE